MEMLVQVVMKRVETIIPNPRNARIHSKRQIHQIAESIRSFGFQNSLLIDNSGLIIAGHGRLAAAVEPGLTEVPVIEVKGTASQSDPVGTQMQSRPAPVRRARHLIAKLQKSDQVWTYRKSSRVVSDDASPSLRRPRPSVRRPVGLRIGRRRFGNDQR